jgi:hypothetical protein
MPLLNSPATSRHSASRRTQRRGHDRPYTIESLEQRKLFDAVVINAIPDQVFAQDSGPEQAYLYGVFADNTGASDLAFAANSTNPSVVTASVSGPALTITPVAGQSGFARIQISATDPNGLRVSNTFRVQITAADTRALDVLLGAGSPTSIHYQQSSGASATVSLVGPGSAVLHFGGDNLARAGTVLHGANEELESITLSDTTAASTLSVAGQKSPNGLASVGNITATGDLGRLDVSNAIIEGDVSIAGALPGINVDYAQGGTISVGSGGVTIIGKSFVDENFSSSSPVNSIKMLQWGNSDNVNELFSAAFVRAIKVKGSFTPGLQLSGEGAPARTLDHMTIPGEVGGTWNIVGPSAPLSVGSTALDWNATFSALPSIACRGNLMGKLTAPTIRTISVRGYVDAATITLTAPGITDLNTLKAKGLSFAHINVAGNIGSISIKLMQFSAVLAAVASVSTNGLPGAASDFSADASIKAITITGGIHPNDFISSYIAASSLGTLQLSDVMLDNTGTPFGVAGGGIGRLQFVAGHRHIDLRNVHDAATLAAQLTAQNASLGDMTIQIV